ncbi:hypothetical protein OPFAMLBM_00289 [Aeromonas phage avDM12-TAAL]|nr:hypothetical protein OPFAMLBM_00289 [Aeromonas phage avDM12-TAAL]
MLHFNLDTKVIYRDIKEAMAAREADRTHYIVSRWDFKSLENAQAVVDEFGGQGLLAIDKGEWASPRFDVIEMPKVGDDVSMTFNGDYYPCGTIVKISDSLKTIKTSTGRVFWRKKLTGQWLYSKTFTLVAGIRSDMNLEF